MTKRSRRSSSRPSRSPPRQAYPAKPPPVPWWRRPIPVILTLGAVAAAITAIVGLIQPILPKHSPLNVARFVSVDAISQVPLSEYPQRSAVFKLRSAGHPQRHDLRLAAAVFGQSSPPSIQGDTTPTPSPTDTTPTPSPTDTTPTPSPTDTTPTPSVPVSPSTGTASPACTASSAGTVSPACTASSAGTASPSATGSPTGTGSPSGTGSPTGGIKSLLPLGMSANKAAAYANRVGALVQKLAPGYYLFPSGNSGDIWVSESIHAYGCPPSNGPALSWSDCAHRLAGLLLTGASVGGPGNQNSGGPGNQNTGGPGNQNSGGPGNQNTGGPGNQNTGGPGNQNTGGPGNQNTGTSTKRQPLGELISVNLELAGLQGQPVFLSWSIFQKDGQNQLSANWLGNFVAYRLEETTSDDTGTLEMWIPLPKQHGPYSVHLTLTTASGDSLASMNSGPFD